MQVLSQVVIAGSAGAHLQGDYEPGTKINCVATFDGNSRE